MVEIRNSIIKCDSTPPNEVDVGNNHFELGKKNVQQGQNLSNSLWWPNTSFGTYFSGSKFIAVKRQVEKLVYTFFCLFLKSQWRVKGVQHSWALFLKTVHFLKNKATLDKVSYGSGQKYSKELKKHSFTSVKTIVVKLQWKMCKKQ